MRLTTNQCKYKMKLKKKKTNEDIKAILNWQDQNR